MSYKIAGPGQALVGRRMDYIVVPGEAVSYRWQVTGGRIIEGQNMPGITVEWEESGHNEVSVAVESHTGSVSKDHLRVMVGK